MRKPINGFSKLSKLDKIKWITATYFKDADAATQAIKQYWNTDKKRFSTGNGG